MDKTAWGILIVGAFAVIALLGAKAGMGRIGAYGEPRSDVERAMNHYGITETEYLLHPECYPLPERGSGLGLRRAL